MMTTEFIEARIADDETAARGKAADAMTGHRWKHAPKGIYDELQVEVLVNSRRMLAQCEAMRRIVELHSDQHLCRDSVDGIRWDEEARDLVDAPCEEMRALAAIWSDHPDYEA